MARDLIGPALPPGFKERATVEDQERDPSPGKQQRLHSREGLATTAELARSTLRSKLGTQECLGPDHH